MGADTHFYHRLSCRGHRPRHALASPTIQTTSPHQPGSGVFFAWSRNLAQEPGFRDGSAQLACLQHRHIFGLALAGLVLACWAGHSFPVRLRQIEVSLSFVLHGDFVCSFLLPALQMRLSCSNVCPRTLFTPCRPRRRAHQPGTLPLPTLTAIGCH